MAINNDRNLLEKQILSNSGLQGQALENLKAHLATLSEQQLQAELSRSLSGDNQGEWYTGVMLEHNDSVVLKANHDKVTYNDENGNEITEYRDGDTVFERTVKSTDEKGNIIEITTTFVDGRPSTQTKSKNGNRTETTEFKYFDNAQIPYVTVETKKSDNTKIVSDVLEVDENGNIDNEDIIQLRTISANGRETYIYKDGGYLVEQILQPDGKKILNQYNGDNIEDLNSGKLHRLYQKTEFKGKENDVAYDGEGNTYVQINAGETAQIMAARINKKRAPGQPMVTAQQIINLNPKLVKPNGEFRMQKLSNGMKGLGEVKIPGEFDVDASFMRTRQSIARANNLATKAELQRQVTQKITEGTDAQTITELSNNGFKPTTENAIFYEKFKTLNPSQQQNTLSIIKYCRSQGITDLNRIKAEIYKTCPDINLFDSGKTINGKFNRYYGMNETIPIEIFLMNNLKLDLNSADGKKICERLKYIDQSELSKAIINGEASLNGKANFDTVADYFEGLGIILRDNTEYSQITATRRAMENGRKRREQELGIPTQRFAQETLANMYDQAADMLDQYYYNHGVLDVGLYMEGFKNIEDWLLPDNILGADMRGTTHIRDDCRAAAERIRKINANSPEQFKEEFAKLKKEGIVSADFNFENINALMDLVRQNNEKMIQKYQETYRTNPEKAQNDYAQDLDNFRKSDTYRNAFKNAFGFRELEGTEEYIGFNSTIGSIGDIVLMLATLGATSESKIAGKAAEGIFSTIEKQAGRFFSKGIAQKTAKIGTSMAMGGTTLGGFTLGKETINNFTNPMRDATSWNTWKETFVTSGESFGFGAFGGLLNEIVVAPVVKLIEKPATKATQAVTKAFTQTEEMSAKQIMQAVQESGGLKLDGLFNMNAKEFASLIRTASAKTTGFGLEAGGFALYEASLDVVKDLIDPKTGRLPDDITVESLTKYLGEKFGEQVSNLGTIKGISQLLMMSKGGKIAQKAIMDQMMRSENLNNMKFRKAEINGREIFEVTMPDGNRAVVSSPEQAIAMCNMAMQMEFLNTSFGQKRFAENEYPSLSEIDKHTRDESINQANLSYRRFSAVNGRKAQQQVSDYLDKLLEIIPDDAYIPDVKMDDVQMYADFILPDGTVISRNHAGDTGEIFRNPKTNNLEVRSVDNAVLFWIRDINGNEHVIPALSKSNLAKAKRILGYMSTLQEVPRMEIVTEQNRILAAKKGQANEPNLTPQGIKEETNSQVEWRKMKIGDEEVEVAVTKNPDGTENVDFSKCRKQNANGEYEPFKITTEADLLNSESDVAVKPTKPINNPAPETVKENFTETLNILNQKKGLKDIKDDVKNQIAKLVGNSLPENQNQMIELIYKLKNAKERWGEKTQEYNDEQLLQIIKTASNPDGTLNLTVLQRICKRMDGGPGNDNFNMTKILPKDTKEFNLARRSDGFFDEDLVLIGKKLIYAHETREEIFKLLKDENGNPIKDLVDLVRTDKEEDFDDGSILLNTLKSLYTDNKIDMAKVNRMKALVNDGVSIYHAAAVMQSDMPKDIADNIAVFSQKGFTNNEINSVITYLKSQNIEPTFEAVKNTVENCGNITELRDVHVKHLLNQRGENIEQSYYNQVKKLAQQIEQYVEKNPFDANKYPKDIVGNYIKLLHIEGRSVQLKQREIIELLYDRSKGTCPFDIDKLVDSGLLGDIPGRSEPLKQRDLMMYQREDTDVLKKAISKGLLGKDYSQIMSLRDLKGVITTGRGGRTRLSKLVELSDTELKNLKEMDLTDLDFSTASSLAKCDPQKLKQVREAMKRNNIDICSLRDFNIDLADKLCKGIEQNVDGFNSHLAWAILRNTNPENVSNAHDLVDHYKNIGITLEKVPLLVANSVSEAQIRKAIEKLGKDKINSLPKEDLIIACKFIELCGKKDINEIPMQEKKDLLHSLVLSNNRLFGISEDLSKDFPLIPKNQEEYCSLLPSIVRSLGIETNELSPQRITVFNESVENLSESLAKISDNDFANMHITQEYSKDQFILDVMEKVKSLSEIERQKVYDYFGFELVKNSENPTGFSISGYPRNLNNGQKLAHVTDPKTKTVVEDLRTNVVRFSENNRIKCENPEVERFLNEVIEALPELRTAIGRKQHGSHSFDVMQHSLKVMQKVTQDPKFAELNASDRKIMLLASLMHDITKTEGQIDKTHAGEGSFDTFFIAKKFNLTKEEEIKLNTLIKHHEWLGYVNTAKSEHELTKRLQSVAFDLHQGNLFDMAEIFTHADLKAVRVDDSFHDTKTGKNRVSFDGSVRSYGESADIYAKRIREYAAELQKSQPLLPQTKIPRANRINEVITQVNPDGSTNIKGVYKDKDGLIIIKFNEVEDWEAIGFPQGSVSHGYEIKKGEEGGDAQLSDDVDTGNIKFFVHGLDYANQLAKFDAFSLVDSDALLSVSYAERPESKFRFFRPQGVLLDVNSQYIHGGGNTDAGSGCGKNISEFKNNYIFGGKRESDRLYISNLIKKATGMTEEQYIEFVKANKDRPIQEIEPADAREKIIKAFATINSNTRKGKREYNEMYISNPNEVMAVFAYDIDYTENIGNPVEFLNRTTVNEHEKGYADATDLSVKERTEFLRQYALERNLPFIVFGD